MSNKGKYVHSQHGSGARSHTDENCAEGTVVAVRDAYLGMSVLVPYWQNNAVLRLRNFCMFW